MQKLTNLRHLREHAALTQAETAEHAGIAESTYRYIENLEVAPRPRTVRKIAGALGVEPHELWDSEAPKAPAPTSPEPSLFNGLEEERRTAEQFVAQWKDYVTMRVDWCEQVVERTAETEWNNPFLSLDSAIQWAMYIGIEAAQLRNIVNQKVIPRVDPPEAAQELQRLVQRFAALSDRTDERVNAMIEAAELDEEEKEQTKLRLIHGGKKSA